jgi:hypothetical protein
VYTRAQNLKCEATKARRAAERSSHGILNGAVSARWRPGEIFKIHLPPSLRDTEKTLARTEIKNIFLAAQLAWLSVTSKLSFERFLLKI